MLMPLPKLPSHDYPAPTPSPLSNQLARLVSHVETLESLVNSQRTQRQQDLHDITTLWNVAYELLPRGTTFYELVERKTGQPRTQVERYFDEQSSELVPRSVPTPPSVKNDQQIGVIESAFVPLLPEPSMCHPIYYMRDNHTFVTLSDNIAEAIIQLNDEFQRGYTSGMICSKRPNFPSLNFNYTELRGDALNKAMIHLNSYVNSSPEVNS